jgi:hypothetical protein
VSITVDIPVTSKAIAKSFLREEVYYPNAETYGEFSASDTAYNESALDGTLFAVESGGFHGGRAILTLNGVVLPETAEFVSASLVFLPGSEDRSGTYVPSVGPTSETAAFTTLTVTDAANWDHGESFSSALSASGSNPPYSNTYGLNVTSVASKVGWDAARDGAEEFSISIPAGDHLHFDGQPMAFGLTSTYNEGVPLDTGEKICWAWSSVVLRLVYDGPAAPAATGDALLLGTWGNNYFTVIDLNGDPISVQENPELGAGAYPEAGSGDGAGRVFLADSNYSKVAVWLTKTVEQEFLFPAGSDTDQQHNPIAYGNAHVFVYSGRTPAGRGIIDQYTEDGTFVRTIGDAEEAGLSLLQTVTGIVVDPVSFDLWVLDRSRGFVAFHYDDDYSTYAYYRPADNPTLDRNPYGMGMKISETEILLYFFDDNDGRLRCVDMTDYPFVDKWATPGAGVEYGYNPAVVRTRPPYILYYAPLDYLYVVGASDAVKVFNAATGGYLFSIGTYNASNPPDLGDLYLVNFGAYMPSYDTDVPNVPPPIGPGTPGSQVLFV